MNKESFPTNNTEFQSPADQEVVDQTPRSTYEERGEKTYQATIEQQPSSETNRFMGMSIEEANAIDLDSLSEQELRSLAEANRARLVEINSELEKLGVVTDPTPEATTTAPAPEATTAPATASEAPQKDLSGLDIVVADHPENSLETPASDAPATNQAVAPVAASAPAAATATSEAVAPTEVMPAATSNAVAATNTEVASTAETISEAEAQATYEKATKNSKLKNFFLKKVLPVVLAAAIAIGSVVGVAGQVNNANANDNTPQQTPTEQVASGEQHEHHGIYDGYGEYGMWESSAKGGPYDFAAASEVADVCNNNQAEMIIYTADNENEAIADYYAHVPDQKRPDVLKGIVKINDIEDKLESLSADEYDAVKATFEQVHRDSTTTYEQVVVNGDFHNAYMAKNNPDAATTHENMRAVDCVTNENGTIVTKVTYHDAEGNELGFMLVKTGTCMQAIDQVGANDHLYSDLTTITPPDTVTPPGTTPPPDTTPPGTTPPGTTTPPGKDTPPDEQIKPKDGDNLQRIDENINKDIAEDIGTGKVENYVNPGVSQNDLTEKPSSSDYQGTAAETTQNSASQNAEPVQSQISQENNYSQNNGGANSGEYAPVQANDQAQAAADKAETPVSQAPTGGQEVDDILSDLGIN